MRSSFAAALSLVCAFSISAATITSINPSTVRVNSGEHFLTVNGSGLYNTMVFDGPAGHFEVQATASFVGSIVGWVPEAVVQKSGVYTFHVRSGRLVSNSVNFTVQGFKFFPLAILAPEALLIQAKSREGATAKYEVFAAGSADPNPIVRCLPESGSFFKFGNTTVTCDATSSDGDKARTQFTVTVADMMPPILKLPEPIFAKPDSPHGAKVEFSTTAFDEIYGDVVPECLPRSGSLFPIGRNTVTCSATDVDLNTEWGSFEVTVDGEPVEPLIVITPDELFEKARDAKGAEVFYEVAVKNSKGTPVVDCTPASGALFPIGPTEVYCLATDELGGRGEAWFRVHVYDPAPPEILKLSVSPEKLSPADGRMVPVRIEAIAVDDIDVAPVCSIIEVTANEPIDLPGDGEKDPTDVVITDLLALDLRAEANERDRIYDILVDCSDWFGNQNRAIVNVFVPKGTGGQTTVAQPTKRRAVR